MFHKYENRCDFISKPKGIIGITLSDKRILKNILKNMLVIHMLVLAAAVSHSPAKDTISRPQDNWLK